MLKRYASVVLLAVGLLCVCCSSAFASLGPGWDVFGEFAPTNNLPPGGKGYLDLYVFDVGGASGYYSLSAALPQGVTVESNTAGCTGAGTSLLTCYRGAGPGGPDEVSVPVAIAQGASGEELVHVTVTGPGAPAIEHATVPARFGTATPPFGIGATDVFAGNENGTQDTQAGSNPYQFTVAFAMNTGVNSNGAEEYPAGGEIRDLDVNMPPGFNGNTLNVPRCTRAQFDAFEFGELLVHECPIDTQIGWDSAILAQGETGFQVTTPVFNLVPPAGVAAEFGFTFSGISVFIDARVRSGGDNAITVHSDNLPQRGILFNSTTIWGEPASHDHDFERAGSLGPESKFPGCIPAPQGGGCASDVAAKPFLIMPTSCGEPAPFTEEVRGSYSDENSDSSITTYTHNSEGTPTGMTGCEKLVHFEPLLELLPETAVADSPTGLSTNVNIPLGVNPEQLATSGLKNTTVVLPQGVGINPGQATGLVACQPSQENVGGPEAESESEDGPPSCPIASKVGTDEIETPLVPETLKGNVYILDKNPPNLEMLVSANGDGVFLKLIGKVHLNEQTGQLTTTFEKTPDTPFTKFRLAFSGGAQAALTTPDRCGIYYSSSDFTPWSSPFIGDELSESSFQITSGPGGAPCQWPLPFAPTMTAGATTDQAGGYTSFTMLLQRGDGQQRMKSLQFRTPEGLLGMISTVTQCEEPQAAKGECSAASQIGHTIVDAGPGPYPFQIPEEKAPPAPIYLTGPYEGAPYGLAIVVPVVAGPFNVGTIIVRGRIEVNRRTSELTITTDELPQIVAGIPTDTRAIDAVIDRPNFMFNPTNCNPMSFSGTAFSTEGASAPLTSHFQMGSCQALKFQPNLKVSTQGKTSRADGASLTAKITYPVGNLGFNQASSQSNINSIKVDLPKQLPSELKTLQKACPAATFEANPANCPPESRVGHATAITPVLSVPLTGPAYFVSHGGEEFPSLIILLQGEGITIELVGSTYISPKTNITSSTFKKIPDVPIQSFELVLPEGKFSALAANGNLCKSKLTMPTAFIGQNGAELHTATPISVTECPKATKKAAKKKHKKSKGKGKKG
jgi:hypothetical protein